MNRLAKVSAIAAIAAFAATPAAYAQATAPTAPYKFDLGLQLGTSGYIGEASRGNIFAHPGFDGEVSFRYLPDTRWALRGVFSTFGLSGNTADISEVLPDNASYSFSSQVYELSARAEFNFLPYGMGETYRKLKRWTPYITAGVSVTAWSVDSETGAAFTIPLGIGFKYKPARRWNLGLEFLMKKTFSDKLDGPALSDPLGIRSEFMKNTDWYSTLTLTISYEFSKRCAVCHYKD